jgi:hypothetical protein
MQVEGALFTNFGSKHQAWSKPAFSGMPTQARGRGSRRETRLQKQTNAREEARNRRVLDWAERREGGNYDKRMAPLDLPGPGFCSHAQGRADGDGVCYSLAWCIGRPQDPWSCHRAPPIRCEQAVDKRSKDASAVRAPRDSTTHRQCRTRSSRWLTAPRRLLNDSRCGPLLLRNVFGGKASGHRSGHPAPHTTSGGRR